MPHDFMPGLAGVPAAKSAISDVDGIRGVLEYRGIRVEELCQHSSFLETSYLLLFGRLPTATELTQWVDDVTHHRRIKFRIVDLLKVMPEHGHPMDALQAAVAALGIGAGVVLALPHPHRLGVVLRGVGEIRAARDGETNIFRRATICPLPTTFSTC